MSKAISYYDWQESLRDKSESDKKIKKKNFNSLGISSYDFTDFMKKWKKENLK
ncbi:MAG: hypothetical protein ACFE9I_02630 [Candidatus Hermodarchaeota archaeon]